MVVITGRQMLSRGNEALLALLQRMAGWEYEDRDTILQTILSQALILRLLHDRSDTLAVVSRDGRVTPVYLGDICQVGLYDDWSGWMDDDPEVDWPDGPTIRIIKHTNTVLNAYSVIYELHSLPGSGVHDDFAEALYRNLPRHPCVNNLAIEPSWIVVVSEVGITSQAADDMAEWCLKEIQAVLALEPDSHHEVIRVDATDFANPDNAIGVLEPSWLLNDFSASFE